MKYEFKKMMSIIYLETLNIELGQIDPKGQRRVKAFECKHTGSVTRQPDGGQRVRRTKPDRHFSTAVQRFIKRTVFRHSDGFYANVYNAGATVCQWVAGPAFNQGVGGSIPALVDVSLSKALDPESLPVAVSTVCECHVIQRQLNDVSCFTSSPSWFSVSI